MSSDRAQRLYELFQQAKDLPPDLREPWLARLQEPADLIAELRTLLANASPDLPADQSPTPNHPFRHADPGAHEPSAFRMPESVGAYRLLSVLGEGGFGTVYLGERREPFVQRAAIKVIKPGMDSKAVVARFEQERQALAVMDHPNIAKVLDAGVTTDGRPYFVMEHVKGEPITQFCDLKRLPIRQRLELFIPVCEAVQHAHHKGIIHRDLKPSNILVMEVEGRPVPKVIDFGVAKAVSHTLTEKTIFTERGQLIGTPEYMSPEQAEMGALDIDTRTDVYSLGVVLYQLLTGLLPFEPADLRARSYAEIQRFIREVEPPTPSRRFTAIGQDLAIAIANKRQTQHTTIARELHRELEWIPLKAMRKERDRRYATPQDLAADLRRYLAGQPLLAAPESTLYRTRKLVARHRAPIAASVAVLAAVSLGVGAYIHYSYNVAQERSKTVEAVRKGQEIESKFNDARQHNDNLLSVVEALVIQSGGQDTNIVQAMRRVDQHLLAGGSDEDELASLRIAEATSLLKAGHAPEAIEFLDEARAVRERLHPGSPQLAETLDLLGVARLALSETARAQECFDLARAIYERAGSSARPLLMLNLQNIGFLLTSIGAPDRAIEPLTRARAIAQELHPDTDPVAIDIQLDLGRAYLEAGDLPAAARLFSTARDNASARPELRARALNDLGVVLVKQRRLQEAASLFQEAITLFSSAYPKGHPTLANCLANAGDLAAQQGRLDDARQLLDRALHMQEEFYHRPHADPAATHLKLGNIAMKRALALRDAPEQRQKELADALDHFSKANAIHQYLWPQGDPQYVESLINLSIVQRGLGDFQAAKTCARQAAEMAHNIHPEPDGRNAMAQASVALASQQDPDGGREKLALARATLKNATAGGKQYPDAASFLQEVARELAIPEE